MHPKMDQITQAAQKAHNDTWIMSGDASTGTKKAIIITKAWQDAALDAKKPWIKAEYLVAPSVKQRVDMVDLKRGIAYELKVSPNNAHMEVYRDLFKVLVHNQYSEKPLTKFIFITPRVSADRLRQKPFWNEVVKLSANYGIKVSVEGI